MRSEWVLVASVGGGIGLMTCGGIVCFIAGAFVGLVGTLLAADLAHAEGHR